MALFAAYTDTHGVLPLGYTQLEYIENTTTQFIDTGFTPNGNTSVELKAQREAGEWGTFFGSRTGQAVNAYTIQFGSTNLALTSAYGNTAMVNGTTASDGLAHTYYMNKGNVDVDGTREITRATQTFTCPHSAYLFTMYMNAIPTSSRPMKLFYCKIWDDTTLVRHFIPAKRNSDSVVGLYDIVNNVFYTNDGTGDFIAGPVVSELIKTKAAFVKDALPTGYIRLDYIENPDENAYIDTSIAPDDTTGFMVRMSVKNTTADLYYLGARESTQTDSRFGLGVYQGHTYMALGTYYSDVNNWTITSDTPFVAENNYKNSRVATMDGLNPISVGTLSGITFTRNIYLFKSNQSTLQATANCRIYECEITKGNSVVAHFVPCLDNNGVVCLYDTVRHQTFYSAGSGSFITNYVPPVVIPSGYTQLKYIVSDGTGQYIDTGYIATQTTNIECDFMVTQHNSNLLNYVYGEYTSNKACAIYVSSSTNVYGILYGNVDRNTSIPRVFNEKVHSILNSSDFTINETTENVGGGGTFTATNTLYLFRGNGSTRPGMIGRIYYMLIREARQVVSRYLVPCLNDQSQVGFYDVVTEQFYAATGTFTYETGVYEDLPTYNSPVEIQLFNFN